MLPTQRRMYFTRNEETDTVGDSKNASWCPIIMDNVHDVTMYSIETTRAEVDLR